MLQGALIGLVVALAMAAIRYTQNKKGATTILAALKQSQSAAREAVDSWQPQIHGKISNQKFLKYLERIAWLAIIGDFEGLEQEGAAVQGSLTVVTQLQALTIAGLLAHRQQQSDVDAIEQISARIESEGGMTARLVKKQTADLCAVAQALAGQASLDQGALKRMVARAGQSGPAQKVVLFRLAGRACEATGQDGRSYIIQADEVLANF